ncbi:MAG: hypothetical protein Q7U10_09500 [Thermodesulfovibrionia bacterium]|nr:hypothetical protein [Thermodesulfovibrionia bacterium]
MLYKTKWIVILFVYLIFLTTFHITAYAATLTWNGEGGDNLSSNSANWSGAVAPQHGDNVVFDNTSLKDCTWDLNVTTASITKYSGYTGSITKISGASLAIAKVIRWSGGGSDNLASNPSNWSGGVIPKNGDKVILNDASSDDMTWDLAGVEIALFSISSAYSGTVTLNTAFTVTGNIYVAGGTLNLNNYGLNVDGYLMLNTDGTILATSSTITVKGHWVNAGTFNAGTSTVILAGTDQYILGNTVFYNLSKTVLSADTLYFEAGKTITILNSLTLHGVEGAMLTLLSTSPGSYWSLDPRGARNISYVSIQDLNNVNFVDIVAIHSQNLGNNSGIGFGGSECVCLDNQELNFTYSVGDREGDTHV